MSLLDSARRLAHSGFTPWEDSCHLTCESCGQDVETTEVPNGWTGHTSDCPWLSMPRIVAALEAAERVVEAHDECTAWEYAEEVSAEVCALQVALRGEVVPSR